MGLRPIHHLMIGLYAPVPATPEPTADNPNPVAPPAPVPVILSFSVPEPSAIRLREGLGSAEHETIPGVILTHLAQAFQRCDEIAHNPKDAPAPPADRDPATGRPLEQVYREDLVAVIEGRAHFAYGPTGDIILEEGPALIDQTEPFQPMPDPLQDAGGDGSGSRSSAAGSTDMTSSGADAAGNGSASPNKGSTEGLGDGSVSGEKHTGGAGPDQGGTVDGEGKSS